MNKVKSITKIKEEIALQKKKGKKTALITGCFDIIHIGHLKLFEYAKKNADVLVVGIENDKSVSSSKGKGRPIFNQKDRAEMLSRLTSVDYVFINETLVEFGSLHADDAYERIVKTIGPDFIVTTSEADKYWKNKANRARKMGTGFLANKTKRNISSTKIAKLLLEEQ